MRPWDLDPHPNFENEKGGSIATREEKRKENKINHCIANISYSK
jgi:hypothetical protein